jgi:hypothetical protein
MPFHGLSALKNDVTCPRIRVFGYRWFYYARHSLERIRLLFLYLADISAVIVLNIEIGKAVIAGTSRQIISKVMETNAILTDLSRRFEVYKPIVGRHSLT